MVVLLGSLFLIVTNLEAVVEALGLRLDLLGVFQHPLIQHQRLTPLLHQHIRLGYEETPVRGTEGRTTSTIHECLYLGMKLSTEGFIIRNKT